MSVDALKVDARRLAEHLRTKYGWSLKTTGALEAVAISRGYKDWNTLAAVHAGPPSAQPEPAAPAVPPPALVQLQSASAVTLAELTEAAVASKVSDILLNLQGDEMAMHFRIDGLLVFIARFAGDAAARLLNELGVVRAGATGDAAPVVSFGPVSVHQEVGGERVVLLWHKVSGANGNELVAIRVTLDQTRPLPKLDAWGERVLSAKGGLFVIGGATGSGKTTSAKLIMEHALERNMKVAYVYDNSFGGGPKETALNFPFVDEASLRIAMRNAQQRGVDIIVASEIRPLRGVTSAFVEAANSGYTVLTTMFAVGVQPGISTLTQQAFPAHDWLYRALRGLRVQRLLRKMCPHCQGAGCDHCHQRGTKGMAVVSEEAFFDNGAQSVEAAARGESWWTPTRTRALELLGAGVVSRAAFERSFGNIFVED